MTPKVAELLSKFASILVLNEVHNTVSIKLGLYTAFQSLKKEMESDDSVEMAWEIIANVSGGNLGMQSTEWRGCAEKWRDTYLLNKPEEKKNG